MRKLFEVAVEVDAAGHADPHYAQATVYSAVWAEDAADAARKAKADIAGSEHRALAIPARVAALNPFDWEAYVLAHWAGLRDRLPSQADVLAAEATAEAPPIQIAFHPHD